MLRRIHQALTEARYKGNLGTSWGPDGSSAHPKDSHDLSLSNYHAPKIEDSHSRTSDSCLKRHREVSGPTEATRLCAGAGAIGKGRERRLAAQALLCLSEEPTACV